MDKLEQIFAMQTQLNDRVFAKQNLKTLDGEPLTTAHLFSQGLSEQAIGPNTDTNTWLKKFLWAMQDESRELKEELLEKWWSKDHLDMQNIRIEIIDQLHFWVSLALTSGMDAQKVYDIYVQKNQVNLNRQEQNYSKATKDEADNRSIQ